MHFQQPAMVPPPPPLLNVRQPRPPRQPQQQPNIKITGANLIPLGPVKRFGAFGTNSSPSAETSDLNSNGTHKVMEHGNNGKTFNPQYLI
jgi:hypothetical protein